jgi:predicted XRE-type DNA-binding protein
MVETSRTEMATKKKTRISFENSTGNIFAEQEELKTCLNLQIHRLIKARKLTQAQAGKVIGIAQPQVSLLMRNRSGNFSVERLMTFLTALGQDVEITVRPTRQEHGAMSVILA